MEMALEEDGQLAESEACLCWQFPCPAIVDLLVLASYICPYLSRGQHNRTKPFICPGTDKQDKYAGVAGNLYCLVHANGEIFPEEERSVFCVSLVPLPSECQLHYSVSTCLAFTECW
jgi:hypothetical protein